MFFLDVKILKKNKAEMLNTLQPKRKSIDQVAARKPKINVNEQNILEISSKSNLG